MAKVSYNQAIQDALVEEMKRDSSIILLGEDISSGLYGTAGPWAKEHLGSERVWDTPISEGGFSGAAIGAAAVGMRPVVYSMISMMWVAMDQIVSQASKMRYMFGGQVKLPVVFRLSELYASAAHHSDRPHGMFWNMPGLYIVMPTTPYDAKGLLKTALRGDNPVLFIEDRSVSAAPAEVPDQDYTVPFGVADVKRVGKDVTLVAIGGMMPVALAAAERLASDGVSAEVIDPRTLVPFDKQTIMDSVAKTGRLVVVDAGPKSCGAAAEIAALVAEEGFWNLRAPVMRVTAPDVHVPFSPPLIKELYPDADKVITAVKATFA